eukprot:5863022-Pyramimonas_sp.AAC.1
MGPRNALLCTGWGDACEHPTGAFGGAPYGATTRCIMWGRRMRTPPLGPSVELPMGPRNTVVGGGDACEHRH